MAGAYDEIITTTLKKRSRMIRDGIFNKFPLLMKLMESGRFEEDDEGGTEIVEPIESAKNSTFKSYSHYDKLTTSVDDVITSSKWNWKQIAGTFSMSGLEEVKNSGKNGIIKLYTAREANAIKSGHDELSRQLFQTTALAKEIDGAGTIITTAHTGTVGGITVSSNTFWQNKINTDAGAGSTIDFASEGRQRMARMFNACSSGEVGVDAPTLIVTDEATFNLYEEVMVDKLRYPGEEMFKIGDFSFTGFRFKGIPIFMDRGCTAGYMYFINSDYLRFVIRGGRNWKVEGPFTPHDQDASLWRLLWAGNLVCSNRKRHGVLSGIA